MRFILRSSISTLILVAVAFISACSPTIETSKNVEPPVAAVPPTIEPSPSPSPAIPNLQSELLDPSNGSTTSPVGKFDFKNYSYALPRGWENRDGSEIKLVNGRVPPVAVDVSDEMSDEEKADRKAMRRIGLSYVTTKYFDVTGDGQDEAIVVLKIETGGAAIPQIVYVFQWKDAKPEQIWLFRTGDRADGGFKNVGADAGELVVELYGQDRFLLGQVETSRITGDEVQLCCPTFFTRTVYKWNGNAFLMQGKRLTYSVADNSAPPLENHGDVMNDPAKSKKYLQNQKSPR